MNSKDEDGMRPLILEAEKGRLSAAQYLLGKGANVNKTNGRGECPLHKAAENGHLSLVKFLVLKNHADLDNESDNGETPLDYAIENDHVDVAKFLMEQGSDLWDSGVDEAVQSKLDLCPNEEMGKAVTQRIRAMFYGVYSGSGKRKR